MTMTHHDNEAALAGARTYLREAGAGQYLRDVDQAVLAGIRSVAPTGTHPALESLAADDRQRATAHALSSLRASALRLRRQGTIDEDSLQGFLAALNGGGSAPGEVEFEVTVTFTADSGGDPDATAEALERRFQGQQRQIEQFVGHPVSSIEVGHDSE
jgi:hypothetical protein